MIGGHTGRLDDGGERLQLLEPDEPTADVVPVTPLVLVDQDRKSVV